MRFIAVLNKASSVYEPDALSMDVKLEAIARQQMFGEMDFADRKSRFNTCVRHYEYWNGFVLKCL